MYEKTVSRNTEMYSNTEKAHWNCVTLTREIQPVAVTRRCNQNERSFMRPPRQGGCLSMPPSQYWKRHTAVLNTARICGETEKSVAQSFLQRDNMTSPCSQVRCPPPRDPAGLREKQIAVTVRERSKHDTLGECAMDRALCHTR